MGMSKTRRDKVKFIQDLRRGSTAQPHRNKAKYNRKRENRQWKKEW